MHKWFAEINLLAKTHSHLEFIIPLHPNPNVQKHKHLLENVKIVNPLSHDELIKILVKCRFVITDSGGLQEECSYFNKKCLVCRKVTERPESVGSTSFMVEDPFDLSILFNIYIYDYKTDTVSPYGDGKSAKKICDIFQDNY